MTVQSSQIPPTMNSGSGEVPVTPPSHNPYLQYPPNNLTAFSTTSVCGQPLMTPGTADDIPVGAGASELWYPDQSNAYESSQMYYQYKPPSNSPRGIGYGNQSMVHSHS